MSEETKCARCHKPFWFGDNFAKPIGFVDCPIDIEALPLCPNCEDAELFGEEIRNELALLRSESPLFASPAHTFKITMPGSDKARDV